MGFQPLMPVQSMGLLGILSSRGCCEVDGRIQISLWPSAAEIMGQSFNCTMNPALKSSTLITYCFFLQCGSVIGDGPTSVFKRGVAIWQSSDTFQQVRSCGQLTKLNHWISGVIYAPLKFNTTNPLYWTWQGIHVVLQDYALGIPTMQIFLKTRRCDKERTRTLPKDLPLQLFWSLMCDGRYGIFTDTSGSRYCKI